MLSGWTKDGDAPRHRVSVVRGDELEGAKALFNPITSMHLYSLGPAANQVGKDAALLKQVPPNFMSLQSDPNSKFPGYPQNAANLANLQYEQSAALFADSTGKYAELQRLSAVQAPGLKVGGHRPTSAAAVAAPAAESKPMPKAEPTKQEPKKQEPLKQEPKQESTKAEPAPPLPPPASAAAAKPTQTKKKPATKTSKAAAPVARPKPAAAATAAPSRAGRRTGCWEG